VAGLRAAGLGSSHDLLMLFGRHAAPRFAPSGVRNGHAAFRLRVLRRVQSAVETPFRRRPEQSSVFHGSTLLSGGSHA